MSARLITDTDSDEEVLQRVSDVLSRRIPPSLQDDLDAFVVALRQQPAPLRAMAATYQLDISVAMDDLGWHFANWPHHELSRETGLGLRVLGAERAAELFEAAYELAVPHWPQLQSEHFVQWYSGSLLEQSLEPLNQEMWALYRSTGELGLLKLWVDYARKNPRLLIE